MDPGSIVHIVNAELGKALRLQTGYVEDMSFSFSHACFTWCLVVSTDGHCHSYFGSNKQILIRSTVSIINNSFPIIYIV